MTLREAGNYLAGMNAAYHGIDFDSFQQMSGALEMAKMRGVVMNRLFGKTYGDAPMYGEYEYQYSRSYLGYYGKYIGGR